MRPSADSVAGLVARLLKARGVERVFGLCGGHIMPIWMRDRRRRHRIVDVRDERAAVHMAQAHAELTGELGVALVTAGPGVTNAMTGIANAHVVACAGAGAVRARRRGRRRTAARCRTRPRRPRPLDHPLCPDRARARPRAGGAGRGGRARAFGEGGEPGPGLLDFPTDTLRAAVPRPCSSTEHFAPAARRARAGSGTGRRGGRPAVVGAPRRSSSAGRGARGAGRGARRAARPRRRRLPRHRREPRPRAGRASVGRRRDARRAMGEADVVSRSAGGSISSSPTARRRSSARRAVRAHRRRPRAELRDNRRGAVEMLRRLARGAARDGRGGRQPRPPARRPRLGGEPARAPRGACREAARRHGDGAVRREGRIHPNRLLAALQDAHRRRTRSPSPTAAIS